MANLHDGTSYGIVSWLSRQDSRGSQELGQVLHIDELGRQFLLSVREAPEMSHEQCFAGILFVRLKGSDRSRTNNTIVR